MGNKSNFHKRNKSRDKSGKHGNMDAPIVKLPWETGNLVQDVINADPGMSDYDYKKRKTRNNPMNARKHVCKAISALTTRLSIRLSLSPSDTNHCLTWL